VKMAGSASAVPALVVATGTFGLVIIEALQQD